MMICSMLGITVGLSVPTQLLKAPYQIFPVSWCLVTLSEVSLQISCLNDSCLDVSMTHVSLSDNVFQVASFLQMMLKTSSPELP